MNFFLEGAVTLVFKQLIFLTVIMGKGCFVMYNISSVVVTFGSA